MTDFSSLWNWWSCNVVEMLCPKAFASCEAVSCPVQYLSTWGVVGSQAALASLCRAVWNQGMGCRCPWSFVSWVCCVWKACSRSWAISGCGQWRSICAMLSRLWSQSVHLAAVVSSSPCLPLALFLPIAYDLSQTYAVSRMRSWNGT